MLTPKINLVKKPDVKLIKVLVIEDDEETAELVRLFLSMKQYATHIEPRAIDISSLLENSNPDLVIIDYLLPLINGGELCSTIKKNSIWKHIPVIIYSAYPRVLNSLGNYNCNAFLPKPFNLDTLLNLIEHILFSNHQPATLQATNQRKVEKN